MRTRLPTRTNRILRSAMSRRGKLEEVPSSSAALVDGEQPVSGSSHDVYS
jgi:hypothetical protein